jgi:hypothetical protein
MARCLALLPLTLLLGACTEEQETAFLQFNSTGESLTIYVGDDSRLEQDDSIDLTSSTGLVVLGTATISPAGGPVGTVHALSVVIDDEYEESVGRVTVRTDSGERGKDEYELEGDSADEGYWKITLVSAGDSDEVREDSFTIRLFEEVAAESLDTAQ